MFVLLSTGALNTFPALFPCELRLVCVMRLSASFPCCCDSFASCRGLMPFARFGLLVHVVDVVPESCFGLLCIMHCDLCCCCSSSVVGVLGGVLQLQASLSGSPTASASPTMAAVAASSVRVPVVPHLCVCGVVCFVCMDASPRAVACFVVTQSFVSTDCCFAVPWTLSW